MRIPFDELGGHCVFSCDNNKSVQKVYQDNFNEKPHGDINKVDLDTIPNFDLLLAGFPCQPFSITGKREGFQDQTKGTLFFKILEIIGHHQPKIVFLENVKNLKSHNNGETFKVILKSLEELSYTVYYDVLNARDFGVPQYRDRIYIIALKQNDLFFFPTVNIEKKNIGAILEKNVCSSYTLSDERWEKVQEDTIKYKDTGFRYSQYTEDSIYCRTLVANFGFNIYRMLLHQKGKNPRRFTPKELLRMQGFPDNYKVGESYNQTMKQLGNSVCVHVIRSIAKKISSYLGIKNVNNFSPLNRIT